MELDLSSLQFLSGASRGPPCGFECTAYPHGPLTFCMSLHVPSQPQGAPNASSDDDFELRFGVRVAARIIAVLFALSLIPIWLYLCSMVELGLDYPIRRAGESDIYPTRGTFAFWLNCLIQVSKCSLFSYAFGGFLIVPAICICLYYGFSIRTWKTRLIIALVIATFPFTWGYLHIRFYSSWSKVDVITHPFDKLLDG